MVTESGSRITEFGVKLGTGSLLCWFQIDAWSKWLRFEALGFIFAHGLSCVGFSRGRVGGFGPSNNVSACRGMHC